MRHRNLLPGLLVAALVAGVALPGAAPAAQVQDGHVELRVFFDAASLDRGTANDALEILEDNWQPGYAPMVFELMRLRRPGAGADATQMGGSGDLVDLPDSQGGGAPDNDRDRIDKSRFANRRDPQVQSRERLENFLEDRTGQDFGDDLRAWRRWIWTQDFEPHPGYGVFKANVYYQITRDERFLNFFQGPAEVPLTEVEWGGVRVSGIPALDHPANVTANQASYLGGDDIVYGISVNGEHRAYPRRIMGWHELAWDDLGDTALTVVYCTLCGTLIPYKSEVGGREVKFDTSGLLFRSNKLLYDELTWTLWSSITGEPVIGRMVGQGVRLTPLAAVTTTWGEWKAEHPDTTVLSIDTGFERDYSEGAAYREYFSTDDLMFEVKHRDDRLANKAEILALRFPSPSGDRALAIAADHLAANPVFQTNFAGRDIVVVTTPDGANRVYAASGNQFRSLNADGKVVDASGGTWTPTEDLLVADANPEGGLPRLPAFRAFWFGWYAQYPDTELIGA